MRGSRKARYGVTNYASPLAPASSGPSIELTIAWLGGRPRFKVILPEYANQPDFIRRFEAEAQLIAKVEHPHILPLYDYWREPDGAYIVMRWMRGGSLR